MPRSQKLPPDIEDIVARYKGRMAEAPLVVKAQIRAYKRKKVEERIKEMKKNKQIAKVSELDRFLEALLKNGGNATQAALAIHPEINSVEMATVEGGRLMKEARGLARVYLEKKGYGYGKMMEIAIEKMINSDKPDWWDRLMKMTEYEDFMTKKQQASIGNVNIFGAHKDVASQYIQGEPEEGEIVEEKK